MRIVDAIGIWMRRILIIGVLIAIVGGITVTVVAKVNTVDEPPTTAEARWAIQTRTSYFYASELKMVDGTPWIKNYWVLNGKRLEYREMELELDKPTFGTPVIIDRKGK